MLKKLLVVLGVLILLLLVGVQLFLQYGLTDSIRKYVLPAVSEQLALDVLIDNIGVNLLAGSISMNGVKVANPPGFQEPEMAVLKRFRIKIGIPALLKGGIAEIRSAVVRDGVITVVRNKDGALNIEPLLGLQKGAGAATASSQEPAALPAEAGLSVNTVIKVLEVNTLLHYIDYQLTKDPFNLALKLHARLLNVANYGDADVLSGNIALQGVLLVEDEKCAFDLNGRMAPIVDPKCLSFDVSGSMQEIDLKVFKALIRRHGVEGGQVSGTATLLCRKGVFDPDKSVLRLTLKNIKLTPDNSAKIPSGRLPEVMIIEVPVKGTLDQPKISFSGMLERMLLNPDMIGSVLNTLLQNQGQGRDTNQDGAAENAGSNNAGALNPAPAPSQDILSEVNKLFGK